MSQLLEWVSEHRLTEVECLVPDLTGNARGKIMPAEKFGREQVMRLPESVFAQTVTGNWAMDSGHVSIREIDMLTKPDMNTARVIPWTNEPTGQVIHDCYNNEGGLIDLAPRSVLRHVLNEYEKEGLVPIVAPELEFYLTKTNTDPDYPLEAPIGRSGRQEIGRQAYSIDAVNQFDPLFEDIYNYANKQSLDIDTLIHESGAGQMEVNFLHGDPLLLADQVFLFKRTVREAALQHKMYATFMAKPHENEPGSSMHLHQSVIDGSNGKNAFSNQDGSYSELFMQFIAGQQRFLPEALAFMAPNVNSYRRFAKDDAAPINVAWGYDNRTVGLRVPSADTSNMRVENRLAGADANPYLSFAASLACGLLGMRQKLKPSEPVEGSAYELPFGVSRYLLDALEQLERSDPLIEVLGERFVKVYSEVKRDEFETFSKVISSWEREYLLLNV